MRGNVEGGGWGYVELCCFEWSQNYYLYDITEYLKMQRFLESDVFFDYF